MKNCNIHSLLTIHAPSGGSVLGILRNLWAIFVVVNEIAKKCASTPATLSIHTVFSVGLILYLLGGFENEF